MDASPLVQMSCAPARVKMFLARVFRRVLGMNRDEEIACLNLAFIALGFELGNAQPD